MPTMSDDAVWPHTREQSVLPTPSLVLYTHSDHL